MSTAESLKYFASRPRESQIGAWVSEQSSVIDSRAMLLNKMAELKARFKEENPDTWRDKWEEHAKGGDVPLPRFWGGYRVLPERIEFWQGGKGRVHDRFLYSRDLAEPSGWRIERLAP